ncbi:hypothetical protein BDV12DRAFT_118737 [Aspergillus spectabilis]
MVRLTSIFSRSSGKGSNSSDITRSWTLLSRPQSISPPSPQRKTDTSKPDKPEESRKACASDDECIMKSESQEKQLQIADPVPHAQSTAPNSEGIEPLTLLHHSEFSSRRFASLKHLFRSRKYRRQRLEFEIHQEDKDGDIEGPRNLASTLREADEKLTEDKQAIVTARPSSAPEAPSGDDDVRKVSDTTEKSVNSDATGTTVYRHPSKRLSMPITVVDRDAHPNPFDDIWEASRSSTNVSNPFTDQSKSSESTGQSSTAYSGSDNPLSSCPEHALELSNSHSSWCCPPLSGLNGWPTPADRRLATDSFNKLASELYMEPLTISEDGDLLNPLAEPPALAVERFERRRDRLFGRLRTMRSTIQIRSEPAVPRARNLRRMKTFTTLPARACLMTSLRGKPLESLARLGGYSLLTLPGDFAPTTLSLPVCFVATINYLRFFAPMVQNLFVDPGDLETATQTYNHFADQVLSAEKDRIKIHMTMRSSRMPSFLGKVSEPSLETQNSAQVLGVAFSFRALLEGLPGGILGSMQLYRILVNICRGRIAQGPAQRTGTCLAGLSPEDYVKVRAISLAILALTNPMQLNLICGVFGLCSLLLHETERMSELQRRHHRCSYNRCPTISNAEKLSLDRLTATLGPLLTESQRSDDPDTFYAIQEEIENQRVASLLIGNWRSISRQLRIWERRGLEGRVHAGPPRVASVESAQGA